MTSQVELEKLVNDVLAPYATELGQLLHDWNSLHIAITYLFLAVCQTDYDNEEERALFLAIWNAVPNDRLQRDMLRKAAKSRFSRVSNRMQEDGLVVEAIRDHEDMMLKGILWALDSSDVLGRNRDNSAHLPITLFVSETLSVIADDATGHPIAQAHRDKDILSEFNVTRARVSIVNKYVVAMQKYMVGIEKSWPQKPTWPTSRSTTGDKGAPGQ